MRLRFWKFQIKYLKLIKFGGKIHKRQINNQRKFNLFDLTFGDFNIRRGLTYPTQAPSLLTYFAFFLNSDNHNKITSVGGLEQMVMRNIEGGNSSIFYFNYRSTPFLINKRFYGWESSKISFRKDLPFVSLMFESKIDLITSQNMSVDVVNTIESQKILQIERVDHSKSYSVSISVEGNLSSVPGSATTGDITFYMSVTCFGETMTKNLKVDIIPDLEDEESLKLRNYSKSRAAFFTTRYARLRFSQLISPLSITIKVIHFCYLINSTTTRSEII